MNLPSLWLREMTPRLGIEVAQTELGLVARMPRP